VNKFNITAGPEHKNQRVQKNSLKIILLERAQFVRHYPEIAAATFLAQEKQTGSETNLQAGLVIYLASQADHELETETLDLDELCASYQDQYPDGSVDHLLVLVGCDLSIHYSMRQKTVSFWALEGACVRVFCTQQSPETQISCYGAANSSIQIDMLVRDHAQISQNSHSRIALTLHPQGPHAQMRVRGAYLLKAEQSVRVSVLQKHIAPNATTDVLIKGIVQDKAQAYYEGLIFIDKHAANTRARQENKNIILGTQAVADSRPTLEVLNHEVSCAHGSAVGQLDADQLFYLASRGLNNNQAKTMLLDAFVADLFDQKALSFFGELNP